MADISIDLWVSAGAALERAEPDFWTPHAPSHPYPSHPCPSARAPPAPRQAEELKRKADLQAEAIRLGLMEKPPPSDRSDFYKAKQIDLLDSINDKQKKIAQLEDEIRTHKVHMQRVHDLSAEEDYISKPAWETTGVSVLPYRDPDHTGLSKRTPSGGFFSS